MKYFNTSLRWRIEYAISKVTKISCNENSYFYVVNYFIVRNGVHLFPFCIYRFSHKGTIKLDIEKICQRMYCLSSLINYSFAGISNI